MPYQRGGRDYGPSSTGGTTKYSSRRQVSIGVLDRKSRKPVQVRAAKPAKKDPGVAGVAGGLTGRGQAAMTAKPAKRDPGVMGTSGGLTGRGQAPLTTKPKKSDQGVMGTPGGLTGRGQNNPARTDPHVMGVPGGMTGRKPTTNRMTSPSGSSESEIAFGPVKPTGLDPYLSFNRLSQTASAKNQPSSNPSNRGRGTPATSSHGLTFRGPINGLPWASGQLPLANSLLNDLSPGSLRFNSQPLTAEHRQELDDISRTKEAIRNGQAVPHSLSRIPAPAITKVGALKKANTPQNEKSNSKGIETNFPYGTAFLPDHLNPHYAPAAHSLDEAGIELDETDYQALSTLLAREGIQGKIARDKYNELVPQLEKSNSAGRARIKQQIRDVTPPVWNAVVTTLRPGLGPKPGSGNTATRTSNVWNNIAKVSGIAGRAFAGAGAALGLYRIANADDKLRETIVVGAETIGSLGGAIGGGVVGTGVGGPPGGVAGTVSGALFFGDLAGEVAADMYDFMVRELNS